MDTTETMLDELAIQPGAHILIIPQLRDKKWSDSVDLVAEGRLGRGRPKRLVFRPQNGIILITLKGRFSQATTVSLQPFLEWLNSLPVLCVRPYAAPEEMYGKRADDAIAGLMEYFTKGGKKRVFNFGPDSGID